ncbi:hypothetical protein HBH49_231180 [Parastagonospora nodorum]|nr:hypothetical protein HBH49_231180 [Parastagonospora nodorum]
MLEAALTLTSDNCRINQLLHSLMHAGLRKELGARHSLLNLSVHDLVEERRNYSLRLSCLIRLQH